MIIAYTIGNTKSYDQSLNDYPADKCLKMGKTDSYSGGWIWKTTEEAQKFIDSEAFLKIDWGDDIKRLPQDFSVYGVKLKNGWEDISEILGEDGIYHLLVDSEFFKV